MPPEVALDELARVEQDTERFLASLVDRNARGPALVLPDCSTVARLSGYRRLMWDGEYRVNGVLRNIPEFYAAFNVKPGDKMYLAPEQRVKIW